MTTIKPGCSYTWELKSLTGSSVAFTSRPDIDTTFRRFDYAAAGSVALPSGRGMVLQCNPCLRGAEEVVGEVGVRRYEGSAQIRKESEGCLVVVLSLAGLRWAGPLFSPVLPTRALRPTCREQLCPPTRLIRSRSSSEAVLECCALILRSRGFWYESPPLSRCGPSDAVWHNPKLDFSLAVFTRLLLTHILRLLTGTCNGHEHRSPLRSSHASLLEPARRNANSDAKGLRTVSSPFSEFGA
jgi:hypothetical protein